MNRKISNTSCATFICTCIHNYFCFYFLKPIIHFPNTSKELDTVVILSSSTGTEFLKHSDLQEVGTVLNFVPKEIILFFSKFIINLYCEEHTIAK